MSVPRQTGKTTLIHAMAVHRAAFCGRDVFYTAQTGKDARARWMDLVKRLGDRDTHPRVKRRLTNVALRGGSEHCEFTNPVTGRTAVFQAFAPTEKALHGYTPPTVVVDEAFAQSASSGELLMGAIDPAQFTIVDKQIWLVSTRGTAESTFLHDWIARGVEGTPRVAVFDWGASDEHNPYDRDDVAAFHPGVGFQLGDKLITPDDVLGAIEKNTRAEYERAYANRPTLTTSNLIAPEDWRPLKLEDLAPPAGGRDVTLTYDVALDRQSSTIIASWVDRSSGKPVGKIVQAGPGTAWLAGAVADLITSWRPATVAAVGNGPVLEVTAQLRNRGHDIDELGERDYATSCGAFLTLIDEQGLGHDGDDNLERSVVGLVTRPGAIDGVSFSRRHSVGDSSPGIALAVGLWITNRDAAQSKPAIYFGAA